MSIIINDVALKSMLKETSDSGHDSGISSRRSSAPSAINLHPLLAFKADLLYKHELENLESYTAAEADALMNLMSNGKARVSPIHCKIKCREDSIRIKEAWAIRSTFDRELAYEDVRFIHLSANHEKLIILLVACGDTNEVILLQVHRDTNLRMFCCLLSQKQKFLGPALVDKGSSLPEPSGRPMSAKDWKKRRSSAPAERQPPAMQHNYRRKSEQPAVKESEVTDFFKSEMDLRERPSHSKHMLKRISWAALQGVPSDDEPVRVQKDALSQTNFADFKLSEKPREITPSDLGFGDDWTVREGRVEVHHDGQTILSQDGSKYMFCASNSTELAHVN